VNTTEWKILQIMPSDRWHAGIKFESTVEYVPLVGWALIEVGSERRVTGLVAAPGSPHGEVAFAEAVVNFVQYHRL